MCLYNAFVAPVSPFEFEFLVFVMQQASSLMLIHHPQSPFLAVNVPEYEKCLETGKRQNPLCVMQNSVWRWAPIDLLDV